MEKKNIAKNIAITVLSIALIGSSVFSTILTSSVYDERPTSRNDAYIRATSSGPATLEIVDSWDSASNDVLEQVVENLFTWDLTDLDGPRVNLLAETFWWESTTILHIKLREGVLFHDGTDFDADAAKWNLDRLQYLINATGTNTGTVAHTQSIWMFPDGVTPIMNNIASDGLFNITITLNAAYAPFLSTLTYINAGMISPTAHSGDATTFIDLATGDVVGTGPFTYDSFTPDVEVRMSRWHDYWMRDQAGFPVIANFITVIYAIYDDAVTAHNVFLRYSIDSNRMASDQDLAQYTADPKLHVEYFTENTGKPSLVYQYIGFNNEKYNRTWRKAMSYAINYNYIIDNLRGGNVVRALSPISPGFGASHNSSIKGVEYNLTKARETMVSMGFGNMGWTDAQWISVAEGSSPYLTINYTYLIGNTFRNDLGTSIMEWFKLIGIAVEDDGYDWSIYLTWLQRGMVYNGMFFLGWAPDYLDPYNMLEPLFNNLSSSNVAKVNDPTLQAKLALALETTDDNERTIIYKDIQYYISEVGFFHAPIYHTKIVSNHMANIYGVPYNSMGARRIYPMYRGSFSV